MYTKKLKTLIIHGFGTKIKSPLFFRVKGEDAGLGEKLFSHIVKNQEGEIFFWGLEVFSSNLLFLIKLT